MLKYERIGMYKNYLSFFEAYNYRLEVFHVGITMESFIADLDNGGFKP